MTNLAHTHPQRPTYMYRWKRRATEGNSDSRIRITFPCDIWNPVPGIPNPAKMQNPATSGIKTTSKVDTSYTSPKGWQSPRACMCTTISRLQKPALACIGYAMFTWPKTAETVVLTNQTKLRKTLM